MKRIKIDESQTVSEFIEILKTFPQDLPIRIDYKKGAEIYISEEFYDGDYANPKCAVISAVIVI